MADLENSLCFRAMFSNSAQTDVTVSFSSRADSTLDLHMQKENDVAVLSTTC